MPTKIALEGWDWKRKIPSHEFNILSINHYADWGWATECPFVMMECVSGKVDSRPMAVKFDDIATEQFYYRDWTKSGIPVCNDGEIYWSGFWFESMDDAVAFKNEFGGVGTWETGYQEFSDECNRKRNL